MTASLIESQSQSEEPCDHGWPDHFGGPLVMFTSAPYCVVEDQKKVRIFADRQFEGIERVVREMATPFDTPASAGVLD